jgi:type I restriction enzyme M protein
VLMVYAARQGWYKEAPDQNVLLPHDVLRILIQLLAWGDIEVARRILPEHKTRLHGNIQERLEFEKSEIQLRYRDEMVEYRTIQEKLNEDKTLKKSDRNKLDKRLARLHEDMEKMKQALTDADTRAQQEREAVDRVAAELLEMFASPGLRKRYFAIVDVAEIEENEFNLNIPRYVDTFEPEEEIKLEDAAKDLDECLKAEHEHLKKLDGPLCALTAAR